MLPDRRLFMSRQDIFLPREGFGGGIIIMLLMLSSIVSLGYAHPTAQNP